MAMAMISSHDEFSLLLNKWISESKELFVTIICTDAPAGQRRCMAVVVGELVDLDDQTLTLRDKNGNSAFVRFADCRFMYESDLGPDGVAELMGRNFEDVFVLMTPTGIVIAIGSATYRASS